MRKYIILLLCSLFAVLKADATALGIWTAYPAFYGVTEIVPAGDDIFVLSSTNLYSYNVKDNSVTTYDKTKQLSDSHISHIAWNSSAHKLIIVYSDYNIDIMDAAGNVDNLSDYYNKTMTEDKTVNSVMVYGIYAYLSTGFGVVKVNMKDVEISETYNLGFNVIYTAVNGSNIYVLANGNNVYQASLSANLLDKNSWTAASYSDTGSFFDTSSKTFVYDSTNKCYWTSNSDGKLISETRNTDGTYTVTSSGVIPDGPKYNYFNFMKVYNNTLYTCGGGRNSLDSYYRPGTIQVFSDNWNIYQDQLDSITGASYQDISAVDIDPTDNTHLFASSSRSGLYEFKNGKYVHHFSVGNSLLHSAVIGSDGTENVSYVLVNSMAIDKSGNVWMLNSQATSSLVEYSKDGEWIDRNNSELMSTSTTSYGNLRGMMFDSNQLLWFVNDHWGYPALFKYNTSTNVIKTYSSFVNQDGKVLSLTKGVHCVSEDLDGNIWIGTDVGPLLLTLSNINNSDDVFTQVKVPRNDGTSYADYLLSGVDITCMAVDGANRKWFGTSSNGVYLISADNLTQIHHFLSTNSVLLSDNIESIAINQQTGEVYFGTDKGLCSYMSDATASSDDMTKDNVYAYPNPVSPDYTGLITVVGLSFNADVKIVSSNGTIVSEGRSNGGSFTWDGKDKNSKRVASGIYFVETAKQDGSKGTVCKIAMIK